MTRMNFSRRSFLGTAVIAPFALRAGASPAAFKKVPVGLEMYSVRESLKKDADATVKAVAEQGYDGMEFYGPYFEWTEARTKEMRKLLDSLKVKCFSTHNDQQNFNAKNIERTRDLNLVLGSKYCVLAWSDPKPKIDDWKHLADELNTAADKLEPAGLKVGYHNHQSEWAPVEGQRPLEVLAKNTKPSVMLQLDVGTCLEAGGDPVAWIRSNPGRIHSIHCKEWSRDPAVGYKTLFGEGIADWKGIFKAAEEVGGIEYYLIEQEGSRFSEIETAKRCLQSFRAARGES